jgi:two-component system KDP operon response regulator KdpE
MDERIKVLVVDDEAQITRVLKHILAAHDYSVRSSPDGESAFEVFREWHPDLVVTDLQMPIVDGLELCKHIRATSDIPIVILSVRNDEKTVVEALDAGADDYVSKPFGTNELLARIRSVLRRSPEKRASVIEIGPFRLDVDAHKALLDGKALRLTPKEFDLLAVLLRRPDRVLTHSFLLRNVWGSYYTEQPEALRVLIGSLRKKIEADPSNPRFLLTEPWVGYRFVIHDK